MSAARVLSRRVTAAPFSTPAAIISVAEATGLCTNRRLPKLVRSPRARNSGRKSTYQLFSHAIVSKQKEFENLFSLRCFLRWFRRETVRQLRLRNLELLRELREPTRIMVDSASVESAADGLATEPRCLFALCSSARRSSALALALFFSRHRIAFSGPSQKWTPRIANKRTVQQSGHAHISARRRVRGA